jgi:hypothetical protein
MEIKTTRQVTQDFGLKILVHGPAGAGKTRLCATTGDLEHTLIISAEGGLLSIQSFEIDVVQVSSVGDVYEAYEFLRKGDHKYRWVCLDSISELAEVVLQGEKLRHRDGRRAYGEMADTVFDLLRGFRNLPYNVVMTAKQAREEDEGRFLYVPLLPGRQLTQSIAYLFDEVFALRVEPNGEGQPVRLLQTGKSRNYEAKDRSGLLALYETPDLAQLYAKITGAPPVVRLPEPEVALAAPGIPVPDRPQVSEDVAVAQASAPAVAIKQRASAVVSETRRIASPEDDMKRTFLRRQLFALLREATSDKDQIAAYIQARCVMETGLEAVGEVSVEVLERWARELELCASVVMPGAAQSVRAAHIAHILKRWEQRDAKAS